MNSEETLKQFQEMTDKLLVTDRHPIDPTIEHAIDGIGSEAGELVDQGKRIKWYGTDPDYTNILEECGDILFYMDKLLRKIGSDFDGAMQANMRKLAERYKGIKFTKDQAVNRNLDTEREVLEDIKNKIPYVEGQKDLCLICKHRGTCDSHKSGRKNTNNMCKGFVPGDKTVILLKPNRDKCTVCFGHHALISTCTHCDGTGKEPDICSVCASRVRCNYSYKSNPQNCKYFEPEKTQQGEDEAEAF